MTSALLVLLLMLFAAGETPVGRAMHRVLVERPAAWLAGFTRGQVLLLGASLLFGVLLFLLMEEEGLRLFGMYAPELMGLITSIELTSAVELLVVTVATATTARARAVLHWMRAKLPGRSRRRPRQRQARRSANDEEGPALIFAIAA